jgi:anaerobic ribonucleoside-triphosphate reductase
MNLKIVVIVRKEVIKMKEEKQEKLVGEGVGFDRIRRITGYLVGTVDRFNNGKRAEERDRVKHSTEGLLDKKAA